MRLCGLWAISAGFDPVSAHLSVYDLAASDCQQTPYISGNISQVCHCLSGTVAGGAIIVPLVMHILAATS